MSGGVGYIWVQKPGTDPATDRVVIRRGGSRSTIVAVPQQCVAVQAAVDLVKNGARMIALCGNFDPVWTSKVMEAICRRVPVGVIRSEASSLADLAASIERPQSPEADTVAPTRASAAHVRSPRAKRSKRSRVANGAA